MRLVLLLCAGCAAAEAHGSLLPAPPVAVEASSHELGLFPGEAMAFDVKLAGVTAGVAQLAVGELGGFRDAAGVDHRAVVVTSRAETAGAAALFKHIVDESTTTIDATSGRPLELDTHVELGDKHSNATATFSGSVADVTYTRGEDETLRHQKLDFGKVEVHDAHSAMAQLRGWRARPGAKRSVYLVGGRRLWRVDLTYGGGEAIGTALGNKRVVRYDGAAYRVGAGLQLASNKPSRTFSVWLTDDADRVPVRVTAKTELGEIEMSITEYSRP
ncbi:MAG TPA: DUF3108 domain-containing protein [Kofleriaceae bacterium]|jgi:hypothetical protein